MGTRGHFGFHYKGKYYLVYNHWDSYPSELGASIVNQIKNMLKTMSFSEIGEKVKNLIVVNNSVEPTDEEIEKLKKYTNLDVSNQSTSDWYCLLRECQGDLEKVLESGYMLDTCDTPGQDEYTYVFNLDKERLDFFDGQEESSFDITKLPEW